jgi:hypothetical protein
MTHHVTEHPGIRAANRRYQRTRLVVFVIATVLLCLSFPTLGAMRRALTEIGGDTLFLCVFGLGSLAVLLTPILVAEYVLLKDPRLYCPHCRQVLVYLRAIRRWHNHGDCERCGALLSIERLTRKQSATDQAFVLVSLLLLIGFLIALGFVLV